jgi:hypothetical protein
LSSHTLQMDELPPWSNSLEDTSRRYTRLASKLRWNYDRNSAEASNEGFRSSPLIVRRNVSSTGGGEVVRDLIRHGSSRVAMAVLVGAVTDYGEVCD